MAPFLNDCHSVLEIFGPRQILADTLHVPLLSNCPFSFCLPTQSLSSFHLHDQPPQNLVINPLPTVVGDTASFRSLASSGGVGHGRVFGAQHLSGARGSRPGAVWESQSAAALARAPPQRRPHRVVSLDHARQGHLHREQTPQSRLVSGGGAGTQSAFRKRVMICTSCFLCCPFLVFNSSLGPPTKFHVTNQLLLLSLCLFKAVYLFSRLLC